MAYSAGSHPAGKVHPQSLMLLGEKGHDIRGLESKSWDVFAAPDAPEMDMVITVCSAAAGETCPLWPGTPLRAHWGVEDPAAATTDVPEAFSEAYAILERRAKALLDMPIEEMSKDELQSGLDRIGTLA